ncbi:MAG: hypothetical protein ACK5DJ_07160 [Bacteroidota bacterium]|jgi:hypothetical protein
METVKIEVQHAEHREWLNKIDFYYDDLKIMRHRLEEVAARNTNKSLMAQVEHFQNQFVIQRNELDEMKHAIHQAESGIAENVAQNGTAVNRRSMPDNVSMRDRVERFEKLFLQLRKELMTFVAKAF